MPRSSAHCHLMLIWKNLSLLFSRYPIQRKGRLVIAVPMFIGKSPA